VISAQIASLVDQVSALTILTNRMTASASRIRSLTVAILLPNRARQRADIRNAVFN
jgi:hypothetical protein